MAVGCGGTHADAPRANAARGPTVARAVADYAGLVRSARGRGAETRPAHDRDWLAAFCRDGPVALAFVQTGDSPSRPERRPAGGAHGGAAATA